jgi:hypothetical protein
MLAAFLVDLINMLILEASKKVDENLAPDVCSGMMFMLFFFRILCALVQRMHNNLCNHANIA